MPAFLWGSTDELDFIAPAGLGQLFVQPYRAVWIPDQRNREIMLSVLSSPKFSVTRRARVMVAPQTTPSRQSQWRTSVNRLDSTSRDRIGNVVDLLDLARSHCPLGQLPLRSLRQ